MSVLTRRIYHAQHERLAADPVALERHLSMFTEDYFGLGDGWFEGKTALDAGCGNTAKAAVRLAEFGAEVTAFDIGEDWMPTARRVAAERGVEIDFRSGDVLDPIEGEYDFVCCHGVLIHLDSIDEARAGFANLANATRHCLYTVFGVAGGLFEEAVWPYLRRLYHQDPDFRDAIDEAQPFNDLIDIDFIVYIQNALQAPTRLEISPKLIDFLYARNGFDPPRRLRRFVERTNIRRYEAPLHYAREHPIARALYGQGNLEYLGER